MAMRSSTTASVSRKVRSGAGHDENVTASTARANAMSVAVGTAQPRAAPGSPALTARKISAGSATPAQAAITGSAASRGLRSSP